MKESRSAHVGTLRLHPVLTPHGCIYPAAQSCVTEWSATEKYIM